MFLFDKQGENSPIYYSTGHVNKYESKFLLKINTL